jgi:glucose 1-dehydrogenase
LRPEPQVNHGTGFLMNKTTMRAVGVLPGKREVRLLEHAVPSITDDHEVKVRALEVGICGTDKEICTFVYGSPPPGFDYLILGHESLGEVIEVGSKVRNLKRGDLVVPSVRRPCPHDHCQPCRDERQDFCSTGDFTERGIKMVHGFMTEYYVDDEQFLNPVPPSLRDVAVLVEPLTVAEKALEQVWAVQKRLPWIRQDAPANALGTGLRALVLGAGPVGILGAMTLVRHGFETFVYSRSKKPNPKAELVESFGAKYISSETVSTDALAEQLGNIDLVYEAVGVSKISYDVLRVLGTNGVYVFTGIPAPKPAIPIDADVIMRNIVLKNQVAVGSVNADRKAFHDAISDLGIFMQRWPTALKSLITGRYTLEEYDELLVGEKSGIKNVIALA